MAEPPTSANWLQRQWQKIRNFHWRDVIIAQVGAGSSNVAVGKYIVQVNVGGRNLAIPVIWIAVALAISVAVLGGWLTQPWWNPSQMRGRLKVAIADFGRLDRRGEVSWSQDGATVSRSVYDWLRSEFDANYPEWVSNVATVQIWHDGMTETEKNVTFGVIRGRTLEERTAAAAWLANHINADMVIYGYLKNEEGQEKLELDFYYRSPALRGEPDSVAGRHRLGQAIVLPIAFQQDPTLAGDAANTGLGWRARALFWLTVGLTHELLGDQAKALQVFQAAEEALKDWPPEDGKEVLYYFIGREAYWLREYDIAQTALKEAKRINPDYANAWQTLGALYYDRAQLFYLPKPPPPALEACIRSEHIDRGAQSAVEARSDIAKSVKFLQQAIAVADRSPWPPMEHVAHLTLGFVYRLQGQIEVLAQQPQAAQSRFADAEREFQVALNAFTKPAADFSEQSQQQYSAWAYLGLAETYRWQGFVQQGQISEDDLRLVQPALTKLDTELALFTQAIDGYQQCIDHSVNVVDPAFQKKVVECGCVYYQDKARSEQAQVSEFRAALQTPQPIK